jgi:hypothetical protein
VPLAAPISMTAIEYPYHEESMNAVWRCRGRRRGGAGSRPHAGPMKSGLVRFPSASRPGRPTPVRARLRRRRFAEVETSSARPHAEKRSR